MKTFRTKIGFIGGGNMARSIIGGLRKAGLPPRMLLVSDPDKVQHDILYNKFKVRSTDDNRECAEFADILILATKPQMLNNAISSFSDILAQKDALVISVAAGILIRDISRWIGREMPCIRVMPNTPALINQGVSGLFANDLTSKSQRKECEQIMQAVGKNVWVNDERLIDSVTGISGSGPAYFFKLMEDMITAAKQHGLDEQAAHTLVLETARGAAELAIASSDGPGALRKQVTSPRGTTEAALKYMESKNITSVIHGGIDAAIIRSKELAKTLGEES